MKRGDLIVAVMPGAYGKPRPALVVQTTALLAAPPSVVVCPLTSDVAGHVYRVQLSAGAGTGLRSVSEVMIDKVAAIEFRRIGGTIGRASAGTMAEVDRALAFFLGLRG